MSDVSGDTRVVFGSEPLAITVPMYNTFRVKTAIVPPLAYIVPPQWREAIAVLKAHGLACYETSSAAAMEVESYRFADVSWPSGPFEGRFMPRVKSEITREVRTFPAGRSEERRVGKEGSGRRGQCEEEGEQGTRPR